MRAALTGFGLVCALGRTTTEAWARILAGERGIGPVTLFDVTGQRASIAAAVRGLDVPSDGGAMWSRTDAMALVAAREALTEAGLDPRVDRVGLVIGGTTGGMFETETLLARMHGDHTARVPTPEMLAHPLSATIDRLDATLGPFVRARALCSACSSGANAFALGRAWLELGVCDAVLVGGTDGLCRLTFTGFNALGAIDPEPARPFDERRRGLTLGEGAGFAVLERAERALARGRVHAVELVGVGIVSEAHHITNPAEDGNKPAEAIAAALRQARLKPADVDYVNAHGTATQLNDAMESRALAIALEGELGRVFVSSTKGQIGHTLGAAGAIEAVLAALTVRDGRLPPTVGLERVDPSCAPLRHVAGASVRHDVRVALSNSFGFGGVDTVLAFARAGYAPDVERPRRTVWVTGIGSASPAGALQWDENTRLLDPDAPVQQDPTTSLDGARARRLDRAARLAAVAAQLAWSTGGDGILLGTSYGDTDGTAAFLARCFDRGPRLAPPADFPNLVPSSPSGHVSIYLGLHGPALTVADLSTSGEAAIATAFELVASGQIEAATAGSAEGPSEIVAHCLEPMFRQSAPPGPARARTEGAALLRLMREPAPEIRAQLGDSVVLRQVIQARDVAAALAEVEAPFGRGHVVLGEASASTRAALAASLWRHAPVREITPTVGRHEGLGGFAVAAAAALVARREVDTALAVGHARGRAYAIVVERVS